MTSNFLKDTYSKKTYARVLKVAIAILCIIGVLEIYSATSVDYAQVGENILRSAVFQLGYILFGAFVAWVISRYHNLFNKGDLAIWLYWGVCIAALLAVEAFGTDVYGAKRWIEIGPGTVQPSEFFKVAALLMTVRFLGKFRRGEISGKFAALAIALTVVLPLGVIYKLQNDLGTVVICTLSILAILYLAGISGIILWSIVAAGVLALAYTAFGGDTFRSERFLFLNPWDDGNNGFGDGYNIVRSFYAIAHGGVFGVGIGNSLEKFGYLFGSDNDFIFSLICEELGLVGAAVVIACFAILFYCCIKIGDTELDIENKLIVYGAGIFLVCQAVVNIGSAAGVLPTTGKPLPFVSSGGSSMVTSFIFLGIILNAVAHDTVLRGSAKAREEIEVYSGDEISTVGELKSRRRSSRTTTNTRRANSARSRTRFDSGDYTEIKEPSFLDKRGKK